MRADWAIRLWMALAVGGAAFAAHDDDFGVRLLAAEQLHRQGEYAGAETILLAALKEAEGFGPEDPRKAAVLNNLGSVYHFMDKYPQAEQCYRRAVEIEARIWGADDGRPIRSIVNLAALYIDFGQYAKVERLGLLSLAEQRLASRRNPDLAKLLAALGALHRWQGRYSKAEQDYKGALAISEELAPDGGHSMEILNNLGLLYGETGRNAEALSSCERALKIAARTLNPEHPTQAALLANVGTFRFMVHGPLEAEPYYQRALAIAENNLGPENPLLGQILASYAVVLERTNRKAQAKGCQHRAKTILQRTSGSDPKRFTVDLSDLLRRSKSH